MLQLDLKRFYGFADRLAVESTSHVIDKRDHNTVIQAIWRNVFDANGIIICGTGIGISITANKVPGIRAALCGDCFSAEATRLHNDANILALGARVVGEGLALKIVDTFLDTPFSGDERHLRRIHKIEP